MNTGCFEKPVYLKDGKHLIREISTVLDAIEFLEDWPEKSRDVLHEVALRSCIMAHDGLKPLKVARDAIRTFGKKKGILEKEAAVKPWMVKSMSGGRASV